MKKKLLLLLFLGQLAFGQTNIAVPSFSAVTNSFNSATGNIKFYLGGVSQTLTVGRGANGVCFFGNNMFVAIDDGGSSKGILWYANVSFTTGTFAAASPVMLSNGQGTFSVAADAAGNIYSANDNGTVTKFIRAASAPFYSGSNVATATFWSTGTFANIAGVMVDDATSTLWGVSYANNQLAVCKLSAFGTAANLKKINTNGSYIQKPEGIAKDNLGNIWIGNNNNNNVLRINVAVVNTIISELNAANYTLKTLTEGTNINDFAVSAAGHQLGGITYDNLYSSKLYINDQVNGGNSFVYSFTPSNTTPTFTATAMSQIYPGAGQCAILPCGLLPNALASSTTINSGQTATVSASNCVTGATYQWKDGATVVGTNASFTTPVLNASKTYTVACVNSAACAGTLTNVTVTVGAVNVNNPNQLPNPSLVGYLHNWDDPSNGMPYIQLDNVPAAYNVINYAFGVAQPGTTDNIQLTLPTNVDANAATRTNTFNQKMNVLQNQGKKVLLSLGGSVSHGGVINVGTTTKRDNFILSVTNLLKTYPFDGLDIDIEGGTVGSGTSTLIFNQAGMTVNTPNSPTIDNLIYALKQIMLNYRAIRGKKMLLTFAPERHHITGGLSSYAYTNIESSAAYLPIITALKDSLDLVHTQLYGQGSDLGKNGSEYCAGTMANALAVTEDLMLGYTLINGQGTFLGLPPNKIALGLAALCTDAGGGGFLTAPNIQSVVNYFRNTGSQPAAESPTFCSWMGGVQSTYTKISTTPVEFRGLMTWSINNDVKTACGNNGLAAVYTNLYGTFAASTNTKNILTFSFPNQVSSVINATTNTVTVTMPAGTNLAALVPTFTLSANTTTKRLNGVADNFSLPVQYTINHQDNSSKTWTIIVTIATCSTSNPTSANATPSTINAGQNAVMMASGCLSGFTILWKEGTDRMATAASFTTPNLNASTTYTAFCGNGPCLSSGVNVTVTVNPTCTTPSNPTTASASPSTINSGQTSTLTANGCSLGNTYVWYDGLSLVSSAASFTTSVLNATKTYTAKCKNGTCESSGVPVTVNINSNVPFSISPTNPLVICQASTTITAVGCSGTVKWYRDTNGSGATNVFLSSGNQITYTLGTNLDYYLRATCTLVGIESDFSNYSIIHTGPNVTPLSDNVRPNSSVSITASGCPSGTTYSWDTGENTATITKNPAGTSFYSVRCVSGTCQSPYATSYIYIGNVIAGDDSYTLNIDTPLAGNFCTNDGILSPKTIYVDLPPTEGTVIWDNNGNFTYTPNPNYVGADSFKYYMSDGTGSYSNNATVTLNIVCPSAVTLSSGSSPSDDFGAGIVSRKANAGTGSITATNKITGTAKATYQAKNIQLNAGFKADNGVVFRAEVGGCQ